MTVLFAINGIQTTETILKYDYHTHAPCYPSTRPMVLRYHTTKLSRDETFKQLEITSTVTRSRHWHHFYFILSDKTLPGYICHYCSIICIQLHYMQTMRVFKISTSKLSRDEISTNMAWVSASVDIDITSPLIYSDKRLAPETYMSLCSNIWRQVRNTQSQSVLENQDI
jgi:hypothetical protein